MCVCRAWECETLLCVCGAVPCRAALLGVLQHNAQFFLKYTDIRVGPPRVDEGMREETGTGTASYRAGSQGSIGLTCGAVVEHSVR